MKPFSLLRWIVAAALCFGNSLVFADDTDVPTDSFSIVPHGFAGIQSFRVNNYQNQGIDYPSEIFNNSVLNFTFNLNSGDHLSIRAGMEGYVTFSTIAYDKLGTVGSGTNEIATPLWSWYMAQAEMAYSLGKPGDNFYGGLSVGLFPYKYDEEARNLGEYMFRSGTYPGWLVTTFDWTSARLTGAKFSSTLFNVWHNDVMLTTEMETYPFYDLSLSWISDLPIGKVLDLGAGVDFARFIPADNNLTTPHTLAFGEKAVNNFYTSGCDASGANCDTSWYTFKGIKLMGRFTFDPKALFDYTDSHKAFTLGKEDGKIFSEAAVLGVQDQGTYYDNILQRIPVMFGFNFPTFNLLDVLSLQMEYYATPYPDDYGSQIEFVSNGTPVPSLGDGYGIATSRYTVANPSLDKPDFYAQDNWKWSVYAREWFGRHLAIVTQAARDHWRTSSPYASREDFGDALETARQWYFALKIVSVW